MTDPSFTPSNTYTWDADGNLTSANGNSVTYDAFNRMVELQQSAGPVEFVYAGRSAQPYAEMSGQNLSAAYVPLPSGAYAIYNSSGILQYNHADWLGSARVISTPNQTVTQVMSYAPFGEGYAGSGWAQFTSFGNEWTVPNSQARGLDDFLYRRYGSVQGRWISPDPAGLAAVDVTNPQTLNRYAYVMNNPLSSVDPLGLFCEVNPGGDVRDNFVVNCKQGEAGGYFWGAGMDGGFTSSPDQGVAGYDYSEGGEEIGAGNYDIGASGTLSFSETLIGTNFADPVQGIANGLPGLPNTSGGSPFRSSSGTRFHCGLFGTCYRGPVITPKPGCGAAVAQGAVSLGLDVLGAIPGLGNAVSATAAGARAVNGIVAYGGAGYGLATGLFDEAPYGVVSAGTGLGLTLADAALEGGKVIPIAGNVLSVLTGGYDAYQLAKTIQRCW